jgi:ABC-type lipoprotein release transport system permease subunit
VSTLRIARRNLGRNWKRTALALGAITLAQGAVLVIDGMLKGYGDAMVDAVTGPMLGHVQIHAPEFRDEQSMDLTLDHVDAALRQVRATAGVQQASARIYAPVLAARGEQGFVGVVIGLEPARERGARGLLGQGAASEVKLGDRQVLLGAALAQSMGAKTGDELALVGQAVDGSIANDLYEVAGVLKSPVDLVQSSGVVMSLRAAQELFVMPDQAHEITVHGSDPAQAEALRAKIAALPALAHAEVKAWPELAPELTTMLQLNDVFTWIILLLVFIAAAAGVANTMLMATFERNHELGMLLALGCSPARIVAMITLEALILGVCGVLLGTAFGVVVNALFARHGIDFASLGSKEALEKLTFAGMNYGLRVLPRTAPLTVLGGVLAVSVTSLLSALWPALHAARLQPVEAMRG